MAVLVDSNVILDVATEDPTWGEWSAEALARAADRSVLVINPIIFAEVGRLRSRRGPRGGAPRGGLPAGSAPVRGSVPGRQELPGVPETGRAPLGAAAGLLHRRPCRGCRSRAAHPRCQPVPDLLPAAGPDRALMSAYHGRRDEPMLRSLRKGRSRARVLRSRVRDRFSRGGDLLLGGRGVQTRRRHRRPSLEDSLGDFAEDLPYYW